MFIDSDFYSYAMLNNIHALGYWWRWIVIYINADFHQMWNGKQPGPIIILQLLMGVEWVAGMAFINLEFFNGCKMGGSHYLY